MNRRGTKIAIVGIILIIIALCFTIYNIYEDKRAYNKSNYVLDKITEEISEENKEEVITIDGNKYLGIISIPKIGIELPVYLDYSMEVLKYSPAVYSGNINDDNLVICAHNYKSHFGYLNKLSVGDIVVITNAKNKKYVYEVESIIISKPTDVTEVIDSEFDLTLFTCTASGNTRYTVRLNKIRN